MKRILVTGAGGFAGGLTAGYLKNRGYEVMGIVHNSDAEGNFNVLRCDLSKRWEIPGEYDVIVHSAGCLAYKNPDIFDYKHGNIDTMENLIDYAHRIGVKRVINFSTIGVYGDFRQTPVMEESDCINQDYYGLTKYLAEKMLRDAPDIESINLRMPGIIGRGSRGVWLANILERFRNNEQVTIYSPNFETKNFVWVGDLAKFVEKLIEQDNWKYDVLNLSCSEGASVWDIVSEMKRCTNSESEIRVAESERPPFCLDSTKAVEMGYESFSPLEITRLFSEITNES